MEHLHNPANSATHPETSPWGEIDDDTWQSMAEEWQAANEHAQDSPELPAKPVRPKTQPLTPAVLDSKPQLLAHYRAHHAATSRETETPHPEYTPWWKNGDPILVSPKVIDTFRERIFIEVPPKEQFIIGQGERSIRVFNFGESLSTERQKDLEDFVDIATQFMGDRAYDLMSDVIIGQFADKDKDIGGFALPGRGVIKINSVILPDDAPTDKGAVGSSFLQALLHEFGGHLLHGDTRNDPQARADLERFAEAVGWDIKGMKKNGHDWSAKNADNQPYAPHVVDSALPELSASGGSPTEYGTESPRETLAETSKHAMIGSKVLDVMSEASGAWLDILQKRLLKPGEVMGDRPIATPLERKPITIARYTGQAIRYPWQQT